MVYEQLHIIKCIARKLNIEEVGILNYWIIYVVLQHMLIIIRIKRIFWLFSDMCRTITSRNKCWKYHPIFFHLPFSPTLDVLYQTSLFFPHLTCFHFFSSCSIVHTLLHTLPQPNFQGWPVFSTPRPPSPVYSPLCTFKSLFPVFFPVLLPTSPTPKDLCVMYPKFDCNSRLFIFYPPSSIVSIKSEGAHLLVFSGYWFLFPCS